VVAEPVARNTAAAIGAAAARFRAEGGDAAFAVMPADHAIEDTAAFRADLERGFGLAEREKVLVTFGIRPNGPDPNFGYIRRGERIADRLHRVGAFTEKPDRARAAAWIATGDYAWNSGIFVWRVATFLGALTAGRPALAAPLVALDASGSDADFERALDRVFPSLE